MANTEQGRGREEALMSPGLRVISISFEPLRASALRSQSRGPLSWPHLECVYFCPGDSSCSCLLLHCVSGMEPTVLVTLEARGMWQVFSSTRALVQDLMPWSPSCLGSDKGGTAM